VKGKGKGKAKPSGVGYGGGAGGGMDIEAIMKSMGGIMGGMGETRYPTARSSVPGVYLMCTSISLLLLLFRLHLLHRRPSMIHIDMQIRVECEA